MTAVSEEMRPGGRGHRAGNYNLPSSSSGLRALPATEGPTLKTVL